MRMVDIGYHPYIRLSVSYPSVVLYFYSGSNLNFHNVLKIVTLADVMFCLRNGIVLLFLSPDEGSSLPIPIFVVL